MLPLVNLRSVVAQIGRSMGSCRSFSASPYVAKETAGETEPSLVLPYLSLGFCVYVWLDDEDRGAGAGPIIFGDQVSVLEEERQKEWRTIYGERKSSAI